MDPAPEPRSRQRELGLAAATLLLLVGLCHAPALGHGFVYDDAWTIVDNPFLREPANALRLLGPGPARAGVPDAGRPVLVLTELVDHALWGLAPRGWHAANVAWHGAVVVVAFLGLAALGAPLALAFPAAALFAAHPVAVEPVAAINYREDLLATFFVVAALIAARARGRAVAFALALLAVFSKESAVIAPILLVVLEVCFPRAERRRWIGDAAVLGAAAAAGVLWRTWVMGGLAVVSATAEIPDAHRDPLQAVPAGAAALANGLVRLVVPRGLSPEYAEAGGGGPLGWAALAALVASGALAVRLRRRAPWVAVGVLWGLAAALPTLGLVPITNLRADRYLYLPSIGFLLALVAVLARVGWLAGTTWGLPRPWLLAAVAMASLGTAARAQHRHWRDDLALWTRATTVQPGASRAWQGLAQARLGRGDTGGALEAVRRALALDGDPHARALEGIVLLERGELDAAHRSLSAALAAGERHHRPELLNNLGFCELKMGRRAEARARFEEALRLAPGYEAPARNLRAMGVD